MLHYESLTVKQKISILLVALGEEIAAEIYKHMDDRERETLTLEIASLDVVPPDVKDKVLEEFYELVLAQQYITQGGYEYAKKVLEESVGPEKANEILSKIQKSLHKTGFDLLRNADAHQLVSFLQSEQPQTIALILAHLTPSQAANILAALPPEIQPDIAARIATLDQISPEVVQQVERVLESQISSVFGQEYTEAGGVKAVAEILNRVDRATEKNILSAMEREEPELAVEIKNLMFVFDDIVLLDDRAIQQVLKEVENKELALALKSTTEEVKQKIFSNLSERAGNMLREEMEYMGPVRLKDVEECQMNIVNIIRRLEEEGTIIISGRGGAEDQLVM